MKRCRLSFDEWKCISSKNLKVKYVDCGSYRGYVSRLDILEVSEPQIWKYDGYNMIVCANGYQWISYLPADDNYCITAMMDSKARILLWYVDMIAGQGIDKDGIPYFDDLYLDLIVYPDGNIVEDDRDELEYALKLGDITKTQFELANETCAKLLENELSDIEALIAFTRELPVYAELNETRERRWKNCQKN